MPEDDAQVADANGPRGLHEHLVAEGQEQAAHEAGDRRPAEDGEDHEYQQPAPLTVTQELAHHEDDEQERQAQQDVDDAHQDVVQPATEVTGDATDDRADDGRHDGRTDADEE